ncbi:CDC45-like protein [Wallemia mellicola]|uniref:CDC45-like protein n=1 Tax=Wallemia mellicola TaxID=1708541 RepID=A0A4T0TF24_9BASI|nr:hypothetical protein E3Q23_02271 [Wallemia mellicola]TIB84077.1 CDC45-like protein [Wallemia mellicola]TIB87186.1 CDC45-like protein [Wallemia mellicola]TIB91810.1 CDC45-like protein [Wallemia mellicola]TIB97680.1 CDC45-like protein [Wallemia mellicola]
MLLAPPDTSNPHEQSYGTAYKEIVNTSRKRQSSANAVVILASPDVDALCGVRILVDMLKIDGILHNVRVVNGYKELETIRSEIVEDPELHSVIILGFGSLLTLSAQFSLHSGVTIHLIDSSRPWNLANAFGGFGGVEGDEAKVLVWDDAYYDAKEMEDLRKSWEALEYDPEDSEEDSDDSEDSLDDESDDADEDDQQSDEDGNPPAKRAKLNPKKARKKMKQERHLHRSKMSKYYSNGTSHGMSVSCVMYILTVELERAVNDLVWYAILGLTYQYTSAQISRSQYDDRYVLLKDEVSRLNPPTIGETKTNPDDYSISVKEELRFPLLRHWSLYDSMIHSEYIASKLGIWKEGGKKRLHGFLAEMGLPLVQAQQSFAHMDTDLKRALPLKVENTAPRHQLVDLSYPSFVRSFGLRSLPLAAADAVEAINALLQAATGISIYVDDGQGGGEMFSNVRLWEITSLFGNTIDNKENKRNLTFFGQMEEGDEDIAALIKKRNDERSWERNFWIAYDALNNNVSRLRASIPLCISLHRAILRTGASLIEQKVIKNLSLFRLAILKEGPDLALFCNPAPLSRLAKWLIEALRDRIVSKTKGKVVDLKTGSQKRLKDLPFIVACLNEKTGTYLVAGVTGSTLFDDARKNKLGTIFYESAEATRARSKHDWFDTAIVEIHGDDFQGFIEGVQAGLAENNY